MAFLISILVGADNYYEFDKDRFTMDEMMTKIRGDLSDELLSSLPTKITIHRCVRWPDAMLMDFFFLVTPPLAAQLKALNDDTLFFTKIDVEMLEYDDGNTTAESMPNVLWLLYPRLRLLALPKTQPGLDVETNCYAIVEGRRVELNDKVSLANSRSLVVNSSSITSANIWREPPGGLLGYSFCSDRVGSLLKKFELQFRLIPVKEI